MQGIRGSFGEGYFFTRSADSICVLGRATNDRPPWLLAPGFWVACYRRQPPGLCRKVAVLLFGSIRAAETTEGRG